MKTAITCTSFIGVGTWKTLSVERYKRWISYYNKRKEMFGADGLILVDNGSKDNLVQQLNVTTVNVVENLLEAIPAETVMFRFPEHYIKNDVANYPGWWRSFSYLSVLAEKYKIDKIIHVESDAYILTDKMINYIKNLNEGWNSFFSPILQWPESNIMIICGKDIDNLKRFYNKEVWFKKRTNKEYCEHVLPFTNISEDFKGDRYTEWGKPIPADADYACQVNDEMEFK